MPSLLSNFFFQNQSFDHLRHAILQIDFLDPVHAREGKSDAAPHRHATAHVTHARAARRHRDAVLMGRAVTELIQVMECLP